ncbi:hypothetical protein EMIT019CA3_11206 [Bacillus pseudomycoides]
MFNSSIIIYTAPSGKVFVSRYCYGKFSRLFAELITRNFLLNVVLFDAERAFQGVTLSFDSSI